MWPILLVNIVNLTSGYDVIIIISSLKNQQECTEGRLAVCCWMAILILLNNHLVTCSNNIDSFHELSTLGKLIIYMPPLVGKV